MYSYNNHRQWIEYIVNESYKRIYTNTLDIPIISAIVIDNILISCSQNRVEEDTNPTQHAEIVAINNAIRIMGAKYLPRATIYSTIEPCEMCKNFIAKAHIPDSIFGAYDTHHKKKFPTRYHGGIYNCATKEIMEKFFLGVRGGS